MTHDPARRRPLPRAALLAALALPAALPAAAQQLRLPRESPPASVEQGVGLATVRIDYHRPSVKGRAIWGALVPYGQPWRAGANDNTTITVSHACEVEGKPLAAGTYGLHMIPEADAWTIAFSTNSTSWGSFSYKPEEDALRVQVRPEKAPFAEQLEYGFAEVGDGGATAYLRWAELRVPFRLAFAGSRIALDSVRRELRHLPGFTWQAWQQAARWALDHGGDPQEALAWADRSIRMSENALNLGTRSAILARLGKPAEADAAFARALEVGGESDVNNLGYVYLAAKDLERALRVFRANAERHPRSWNVHDSLAEALAAKGEKEPARASYRRALELAPEAQKKRIEAAIAALAAP